MFSKLTLFVACCLLFSCSSNKKNELKIDFSSDSTAIVLTNLDEVSLFRAKEQKDSSSQELVRVFETDEISGVEKQVLGEIKAKGDTLIFLPVSPFIRGREYQVQTILNSSFGKTQDLLKADMGKTIKQQQKILQR